MWDGVDVRQLARWIREMKELTSHIGLDVPYLLHVKQIPTEPIPEDVTKYPVFVMDKQGYCLCGMDLAEVRYIDEVRELMEEKIIFGLFFFTWLLSFRGVFPAGLF